jgi:hypothetical protein
MYAIPSPLPEGQTLEEYPANERLVVIPAPAPAKHHHSVSFFEW